MDDGMENPRNPSERFQRQDLITQIVHKTAANFLSVYIHTYITLFSLAFPSHE